MRHAFLIAFSTAAGLGACAPVPGDPYGYGGAPAPVANYGYYDGGYAPGPYYGAPGYQPYASPGPAIIVGSERRWDDRYRNNRYDNDRYNNDRRRDDRGFRGTPNPPPNRDFGRQQPQPGFGGNRPAPAPVAAARPSPPPQAVPPPPSGGAAFEQWNRTHVNAGPSLSDTGPR